MPVTPPGVITPVKDVLEHGIPDTSLGGYECGNREPGFRDVPAHPIAGGSPFANLRGGRS
jgi:hypothetical protein